MMAAPEMQVRPFLPHSGAMVLIGEPCGGGDDWAFASVRIGEDTMFFQPGLGVPAWVGIEYMAQTVALQAGILSKRAGQDIKIGLLLGSRKFTMETEYFPLGQELRIDVRQEFLDAQMAVFACSILDSGGAKIAEARLNVYQVEDASMIGGVAGQ